jgi:uncharacterized membrane protein
MKKLKTFAMYAFLALTGVIAAQMLNAIGITVRNTPVIFWVSAIGYCIAQPFLFFKYIKKHAALAEAAESLNEQ